MKKYLYDYINYIDNLLKEKKKINYENIIKEHLIKIEFFQHERLIHLLVTLFYALFVFIIFYFSTIFCLFIVIDFILIIFLLFYVIHYFRLENGVQYLYKQYDELLKKKKEK